MTKFISENGLIKLVKSMQDNINDAVGSVYGSLSYQIDSMCPLKNITYEDLKMLRDSGMLLPGQQYRITDYITTTTTVDTQSAGHQFDIIVTADTEDTLHEIASACLHEGDTYFSKNGAKLEAWQIWYCLDNDTERFAWADGNTQGRGVIYRMIDEWNNDCPYDFKNIKFKNPLDTNDVNYYYTFNRCTSRGHEDMTVILVDKYSNYEGTLYPKRQATSNMISPAFDTENTMIQILNFIIFIEKSNFIYDWGDYFEDDIFESFYNNKFSTNCSNMIFENSCYNNIFGNNCRANRFGELCYSNTFGNACDANTFGNSCYGNTFGNSCYGNTFGNSCQGNTFGYNGYNNTFGDKCRRNTFGHYCFDNIFGDNCYANTFGDNCWHNTFGVECRNNSFGDNCYNNTFGNSCYGNTFGVECRNNSFGRNCRYNTFGHYCFDNIFGNACYHNTFGNACYHNTFGNTYDTGGNYYKNFALGDGTQYVIFASTTSSTNYVQNYKTSQGLQGTVNNKLTVSLERNLPCEMKIAKNSNGEVKIYCEADLIA